MTFHARRPNHYDLLGVTEDATSAEIQQAFRRRAKQFHPDLNGARHAREAFLAINEAYHVLRDARRRAAFDESLGEEMMISWDESLDVPVVTPAPQARPRAPRRTHGWFAGLGLVGAMSAAALLVLADPQPAGLPERVAMASNTVQVAATEVWEPQSTDAANVQAVADSIPAPLFAISDEPSESAARPQPAKAEIPAARQPPALGNWQATATQGQMPPMSALDVLAEVPPAAPIPVANLSARQAPQPLARRTAAALVSQVRRAAAAPIQGNRARVNRYYSAVQAAKARYAATQAARARYAAAMAAKVRMMRAQRHIVRQAVKRRYAAY